jgi:hypothetical protein
MSAYTQNRMRNFSHHFTNLIISVISTSSPRASSTFFLVTVSVMLVALGYAVTGIPFTLYHALC